MSRQPILTAGLALAGLIGIAKADVIFQPLHSFGKVGVSAPLIQASDGTFTEQHPQAGLRFRGGLPHHDHMAHSRSFTHLRAATTGPAPLPACYRPATASLRNNH